MVTVLFIHLVIKFQAMEDSQVLENCKKHDGTWQIKSMCRLHSLEAQRIMAVVDNMLMGIEVIGRIPSLCEKLESLSNSLGSDISWLLGNIGFLLGHHVNAEVEAMKSSKAELEVSVSRSYLPPAPHESTYDAATISRVKTLVQQLLRLLRMDPENLNIILKETKPSESMAKFLLHVHELRSFIYERLQKSSIDEKNQQELLQDIHKREKVYAQEIGSLQSKVADAMGENDLQLGDLQQMILHLEDDLERMLTLSTETILRHRIAANEELDMVDRNSKYRRHLLENEYTNLRQQYYSLVDEHREAENTLRKKNYKINTEVDNWIQKYDHDMQERQAYLEILNEDCAAEAAHLEKNEEEFAVIKKEYDEIMEERRRVEEYRRYQEELFFKQYTAATLLQAAWRGYRARKMIKKLKKAREKAAKAAKKK